MIFRQLVKPSNKIKKFLVLLRLFTREGEGERGREREREVSISGAHELASA